MRTLFIVLFLSCVNTFAQVGINTTTPRAALEVEATDGGVLIPRVALTSGIDEITVINPQGGSLEVSTMVYNTATAGAGINAVTPGFYYWNGVRWLAVGGDGRDWTVFGNFDIDPDVNYIGTRNNVDFRVRTNNSQRFNFTNNGRLRSYDNGTAGQPTYSWNGDIDTGIFRPAADNLAFSTNGLERMRINQNGNVGIGTTTPTRRLHINNDSAGAFRITDGTQANGRVLTSDAAGVATWRDLSINNVSGFISTAGVSIPYNTFNFLRTGCSISLPPGRWAVNVTMLMRRQLTGPTPNNSSFWLRTSFTTLNQATLTQAELNAHNDIVGGLYISGNYPGSSIYSLVQGMVIINNTTAGNRTYYYVAGNVDYINTTDTLINFGRNTLGENVITAYRL